MRILEMFRREVEGIPGAPEFLESLSPARIQTRGTLVERQGFIAVTSWPVTLALSEFRELPSIWELEVLMPYSASLRWNVENPPSKILLCALMMSATDGLHAY